MACTFLAHRIIPHSGFRPLHHAGDLPESLETLFSPRALETAPPNTHPLLPVNFFYRRKP